MFPRQTTQIKRFLMLIINQASLKTAGRYEKLVMTGIPTTISSVKKDQFKKLILFLITVKALFDQALIKISLDFFVVFH